MTRTDVPLTFLEANQTIAALEARIVSLQDFVRRGVPLSIVEDAIRHSSEAVSILRHAFDIELDPTPDQPLANAIDDATFERMLEASWRQPLTPADEARLARWRNERTWREFHRAFGVEQAPIEG